MLSLGVEEDVKRYPLLGWMQAIVLAILVTGTAWALGGARTWAMLPALAAVGVLVLVQILRIILTRDSFLFRFDLADTWVLFFLIYAFLRYLTSPIEYYSRLELMIIVACTTIFWVARYGLTHSSQGIFLLYVLAFNGIGIAGFSIWMRMHPEILPYGENLARFYDPRMIGPFGRPNQLGDFLLIAVSAAFGTALFTRGNWVMRVIMFGAVGLMLAVICLTLSWGCWLGVLFIFLTLTMFCIRHSSLQWFFPVGFFLVGLIAGLLALWQNPIFIERITEIHQHAQQHTLHHYLRVELAKDCLKILHDHPWIGSGMATFNFLQPHYENSQSLVRAPYALNEYLNLLSDYGVIGGILVLGFLLTVTVLLFRRLDHRTPSALRILLSASLAAWSAVLVHCLVDFNLHIPACAFAFSLVTGLGLRYSTIAGLHLPHGERQAVHFVFAFFLSALLTGFGWLGWKTAGGFYPYWQAVSFSTKLDPNRDGPFLPFDEAIPLLKKSAMIDPSSPDTASLLGDLYRAQAAEIPSVNERVPLASESIHWYQTYHQINPLDDDALYKLGLSYDLLNRNIEACLCYQIIIDRQPYNGFYHQALGRSLQNQGKISESIQAYQAAQNCPYGNTGVEEELKYLELLQAQEPEEVHPSIHHETLP